MAITKPEHAEFRHWKPEQVKIINDRAVRFRDVLVHEFHLNDYDDPDLWASKPLYEWSQSECGKWCLDHAQETPYWVRQTDVATFGFRYLIMARLSEQNETYFRLKFKI
jgi:hypothetical protein